MRVKAIAYTGLIVAANAIAQATLFRHIEILGVKPNTALLIIVSFAVLRDKLSGAVIGFCAGFLWDVTTGGLPGFYALLGTVTGYMCGMPFSGFYKENYIFPALLSLISGLVWEAVYYAGYLSGKVSAASYFVGVSLPAVAYTMALSFPVFIFVYWVNGKINSVKEK